MNVTLILKWIITHQKEEYQEKLFKSKIKKSLSEYLMTDKETLNLMLPVAKRSKQSTITKSLKEETTYTSLNLYKDSTRHKKETISINLREGLLISKKNNQ